MWNSNACQCAMVNIARSETGNIIVSVDGAVEQFFKRYFQAAAKSSQVPKSVTEFFLDCPLVANINRAFSIFLLGRSHYSADFTKKPE